MSFEQSNTILDNFKLSYAEMEKVVARQRTARGRNTEAETGRSTRTSGKNTYWQRTSLYCPKVSRRASIPLEGGERGLLRINVRFDEPRLFNFFPSSSSSMIEPISSFIHR